MSQRLATRWRLLPLFLFGGLGAVSAQSCDRPKSDHAPVAAIPSSGSGVGPQGVTDAGVVAAEQVVEDGPKSCAKGGDECPQGTICCPRCCLANMGPVCVTPVDGKCPLPDLTVNPGALATSPYIETIQANECELEEACVTGPGQRRVLRFDANIPNTGRADLKLGNPDAGGVGIGGDSPFQWAACHKHFHFKSFAHYELVDPDGGSIVIAGRKQAFCAMDSNRVDRGAVRGAVYDCGQQGISVGWEDSYPAGLPCQFIDITDVPAGTYRLQVHVNPDHAITESDYDNNTAAVQVNIP